MKALFIGGSMDGKMIECAAHAPRYQTSVVDAPIRFFDPLSDDPLSLPACRVEVYALESICGSSKGVNYWFYVHESAGEDVVAALIEGYRKPLPAKRGVEVPYGR